MIPATRLATGWVFDVGNSRIKAMADDGTDAEPWGAALPELPLLLDRLAERAPATEAEIATVNPPVSDRLTEALQERGITVRRTWRSDGGLFRAGLLRHRLRNPDTVGVDRCLGVIAALTRSEGRPVITVDAGSAITVNVATADGVFLGGGIFPGLRFMTESLHQRTAALPLVVPTDPGGLGDDTETAIAAGVAAAAAGGIDRLIALGTESLRQTGQAAPFIVVTGGSGRLLVPTLAAPATYLPGLVLQGLLHVRHRLG